MKKHRITLPEAQHRAALEGKVSMVALRMKPQPMAVNFAADPTRWYSPYAVGDLLACCEPGYRHQVRRFDDGSWIYPKLGLRMPDGYWHAPASRMPLSAVRLWLRITSIRACRVRDVSDDEALRLGYGKIMSLGDDGHRKCLMIRWCKQRGHSADDWAWLMGAEKVEGPRK